MALSDNLVAYWKMDESSGNAADSTGNSNTLTNNNTATYAAGKLNNAVTANGSNQYLSIANASQSAGLHAGGDYSISFWVKLTAAMATTEGAGPVMWSNNNATQDGSYIQMWQPGGTETRMSIRTRKDASTVYTEYPSTGTLTTHMATGTWYHIVITANYTNSRIRVYENGAQVGTDITTGASTQMAQDGPFSLFTFRAGASNFFNGSYDEVAWWSRELTSAEVTSLYGGGTPPSYPFPLSISVSDQLNITESVTTTLVQNISVSDQLNVTESVTMLDILNVSVSDQLTITESVTVQTGPFSISVSDQLTVTDVPTVSRFQETELVSVSDQLTVSENVQPEVNSTISVNDQVTVSESVSKTLSIDISVSDQLNITESVTVGITINLSVYDQLDITESVTKTVSEIARGLAKMRGNDNDYPLGMSDQTVI